MIERRRQGVKFVTGYSRGASGFWVEMAASWHRDPGAEETIAGILKDMLLRSRPSGADATPSQSHEDCRQLAVKE